MEIYVVHTLECYEFDVHILRLCFDPFSKYLNMNLSL